eukprot:767842-Hanusia_phi.AAC.1
MHDTTITISHETVSIDEQPSFRDISITSQEFDSVTEIDCLNFTDLPVRVREELKRQEDRRRAKYGCPSRSKQLEALNYALGLLESPMRPTLVSATGDQLQL